MSEATRNKVMSYFSIKHAWKIHLTSASVCSRLTLLSRDYISLDPRYERCHDKRDVYTRNMRICNRSKETQKIDTFIVSFSRELNDVSHKMRRPGVSLRLAVRKMTSQFSFVEVIGRLKGVVCQMSSIRSKCPWFRRTNQLGCTIFTTQKNQFRLDSVKSLEYIWVLRGSK